jgi:DNA-binding protein WhiA
MTFCKGLKRDLIGLKLSDCCNASRLYGILSFARTFSRDLIEVKSSDLCIIEHVVDSFMKMGIFQTEQWIVKTPRTFILKIESQKINDRILADFGYSGAESSYRIIEDNFRCSNCKSSFLSGCFISAGTIVDPRKGYHLEISTHKKNLFNDFVDFIDTLGLKPKVFERKRKFVAYYKDSTAIEDVLIYMGATEAAMNLMNVKIEREVINHANRARNCDNANIDKIVEASAKDRNDIKYILGTNRSELDEDLMEIAMLRIENPIMSMTDLGRLTKVKLSKSGVSHRLKRIRKIAEELRKDGNGN